MGYLLPNKMGPFLALAVTYILVIQSTKAAPYEEVPVNLSHSDRGCYYMNKLYPSGEEIMTNEPCLNCTCLGNTLMCYLRICPYVKPLGEDCRMERHVGECCPQFWCPEVSSRNTTEKPDEGTKGCFLEGKYYDEGARIPMNPANPCEVCYCIRNTSVCTMQQCELQVEGCFPEYKFGSCCPSRYNCTEEAATTVPPGIMEPHEYEGCLSNGVMYKDGEIVPSDDNCHTCYCMKHEVVCANQKCMAPADDCTPLEIEPGQCCPEKYDCPNATESDETSTPAWLTTLSEKTPMGNETTSKITTFGIADISTFSTPGIHLSSFVTTKDFDISTVGTSTKIPLDEKAVSGVTTASVEMDAEVITELFSELPSASNITQTPIELVSRPREAKITEVPDDIFTSRATKRPVIYPKRVPGEGICRHQNKTYQSGENVTTGDPCLQNCVCINSVIKCEKVECDLSPPESRELCKVRQFPGECCPRYVCINATTEKMDDKPLTTTGEDLMLDQKSTPSTIDVDQTATTPEESDHITLTTLEITSIKTTLSTLKVTDHSTIGEVRETTTSAAIEESSKTHIPETGAETLTTSDAIEEISKTRIPETEAETITTSAAIEESSKTHVSETEAETLTTSAAIEESSKTHIPETQTELSSLTTLKESVTEKEEGLMTSVKVEEKSTLSPEISTSTQIIDHEMTSIKETHKTLPESDNTQAILTKLSTQSDTEATTYGSPEIGLDTTLSSTKASESETKESSQMTTVKLDAGSTVTSETPVITHKIESAATEEEVQATTQFSSEATTVESHTVKSSVEEMEGQVTTVSSVPETSEKITSKLEIATSVTEGTKVEELEATHTGDTVSTDVSEKATTEVELEDSSVKTTIQPSITTQPTEKVDKLTETPPSALSAEIGSEITTLLVSQVSEERTTVQPSSKLSEDATSTSDLKSAETDKTTDIPTASEISTEESRVTEKTTAQQTASTTFSKLDTAPELVSTPVSIETISTEASKVTESQFSDETILNVTEISKSTPPKETDISITEVPSEFTSKETTLGTTTSVEVKVSTFDHTIESDTKTPETSTATYKSTDLFTLEAETTVSVLTESEKEITDEVSKIEGLTQEDKISTTHAPISSTVSFEADEVKSTTFKAVPDITTHFEEKEFKLTTESHEVAEITTSKESPKTPSSDLYSTEASTIKEMETSTLLSEAETSETILSTTEHEEKATDVKEDISKVSTVAPTTAEKDYSIEIESTVTKLQPTIMGLAGTKSTTFASSDKETTVTSTIGEQKEQELDEAKSTPVSLMEAETTKLPMVSTISGETASTMGSEISITTGVTPAKPSKSTLSDAATLITEPSKVTIKEMKLTTEIPAHEVETTSSEAESASKETAFDQKTTDSLSTISETSETVKEPEIQKAATILEDTTTSRTFTSAELASSTVSEDLVTVTDREISKVSIMTAEIKPIEDLQTSSEIADSEVDKLTSESVSFKDTTEKTATEVFKTTVEVESKSPSLEETTSEVSATSFTDERASSPSVSSTEAEASSIVTEEEGKPLTSTTFKSLGEETSGKEVTDFSTPSSEILKTTVSKEKETSVVFSTAESPTSSPHTTKFDEMTTSKIHDLSIETKETGVTSISDLTGLPDVKEQTSAKEILEKTSTISESIETAEAETTTPVPAKVTAEKELLITESTLMTILPEKKETTEPESSEMSESTAASVLKTTSDASRFEEKQQTEIKSVTGETDIIVSMLTTLSTPEKELITAGTESQTSVTSDSSTHIQAAEEEFTTKDTIDEATKLEGTSTEKSATRLASEFTTIPDTSVQSTASISTKSEETFSTPEKAETTESKDATELSSTDFDEIKEKPTHIIEDKITTSPEFTKLDLSTLVTDIGSSEHEFVSESKSTQSTEVTATSEPKISSEGVPATEKFTDTDTSPETLLSKTGTESPREGTESTTERLGTVADLLLVRETSKTPHSEVDTEAEFSAETVASEQPLTTFQMKTTPERISISTSSSSELDKVTTISSSTQEAEIETTEVKFSESPSTKLGTTAKPTDITSELPIEKSTTLKTREDEEVTPTHATEFEGEKTSEIVMKASTEIKSASTASVATDTQETAVTSKFATEVSTAEQTVHTASTPEEISRETTELKVATEETSTQYSTKISDAKEETDFSASVALTELETSTFKPILDTTTKKSTTVPSLIEEGETATRKEISDTTSIQPAISTELKLSETELTDITSDEKASTFKDAQTTTTSPVQFDKKTTEELLDAEITTEVPKSAASRTTIDSSEKTETTKLITPFIASETTTTPKDEGKKEHSEAELLSTTKLVDSFTTKSVSLSPETQKEFTKAEITMTEDFKIKEQAIPKIPSTFEPESVSAISTKETRIPDEISTPVELTTKEFEVTIVSEDDLQSKKTFAADSMVVTTPSSSSVVTELTSKLFSSDLDRAGAIATDSSDKDISVKDTESVTEISSKATTVVTSTRLTKIPDDATEEVESEKTSEILVSSTTGHPHEFTTREKDVSTDQEKMFSPIAEDILFRESSKSTAKLDLPIITTISEKTTSSTPESITKTTLFIRPTQEQEETMSVDVKLVSKLESTTTYLDQGSTTTSLHIIDDKQAEVTMETKKTPFETDLPTIEPEQAQKSEFTTSITKVIEEATTKEKEITSTTPPELSTEIHMDGEKTSSEEEITTKAAIPFSTSVEGTEQDKTTKSSTTVPDKTSSTSISVTTEEETMEAELTTLSDKTEDVKGKTSAETISTTFEEFKTTTLVPTDLISKKLTSVDEKFTSESQLETGATSAEPEKTHSAEISTTFAQTLSTVEQSFAAETVISTVTASSEETEKAESTSSAVTHISETTHAGATEKSDTPSDVMKTSTVTFESSTKTEFASTDEIAKETDFMLHPSKTTSGVEIESSSPTFSGSVASDITTVEASAVTESTSSTATTFVTDLKTEVAEAEAAITTTTAAPITDKVLSTIVTKVPLVEEDTTLPTEKKKCTVNETVYENGAPIHTLEACEKCSCYDGDILCYKIICKLPKIDCRALTFEGDHCCPLSFECPLDNGTTETITITSTEAVEKYVTTTMLPEKVTILTTHLTPETLLDAISTRTPSITTESQKELTSEGIVSKVTTKIIDLATGTTSSKTEAETTSKASSTESAAAESTMSPSSSSTEVFSDSKTSLSELEDITIRSKEAETTTEEPFPTSARTMTTGEIGLTTQPKTSEEADESSTLQTSEVTKMKAETQPVPDIMQTTKALKDSSTAKEITEEFKDQSDVSTTFKSIESSTLSPVTGKSTESESATTVEKGEISSTVEEETKQTTIEEKTKVFDMQTSSEVVTEHSELEAETIKAFESSTLATPKAVDITEMAETTLKTSSSDVFTTSDEQTDKTTPIEVLLDKSTKLETDSKTSSFTTPIEVSKLHDVPSSTVVSSSEFTTEETIQSELSSFNYTEKSETTRIPLTSTLSSDITSSEVRETGISKEQTTKIHADEISTKQFTSTEPSIKAETETKGQLTSVKSFDLTKGEITTVTEGTESILGEVMGKGSSKLPSTSVLPEKLETTQKFETDETTFVTQTIPTKLHTIPIMSRGRLPSSTVSESTTEVIQDTTTEARAKSDLSAEALVPEVSLTTSERESPESQATTVSEAVSETTSIRSITDKVFTFVSTRFTELFSDTTEKSVELETETKHTTVIDTSTSKPSTFAADKETTFTTTIVEELESKSDVTSRRTMPEATLRVTETPIISSTIAEKIEEHEVKTKHPTIMEESTTKISSAIADKETTTTMRTEEVESEAARKITMPETTQKVTEVPTILSTIDKSDSKTKLTTVMEEGTVKTSTDLADMETTITMMAEDMESKSEETSRSTVSDITQKVTEIPMILSTIEKSEEPETKTKLTTEMEEGTVKTSTALADKETTVTMMAEDMESKSEETSRSTVSDITQKVTEIPLILSTIEKSEEPETETKLTTEMEEGSVKTSTTLADKETTVTMMAEDMESKSEETSRSTLSDITQKVTEIPMILSTIEKSEEPETKTKLTTEMEEGTVKTSTALADNETTVTMMAEDMESKSEETSRSTVSDITQKVTEIPMILSTIEKSEEPETKTKLTTVMEEGTVKTSTALDKETTVTMMAEDMESKSEETSRSTVSDITQKVTEIPMILSTIEKSEEPETKTKLTTLIEEGTVKTSTVLADKGTTVTMMAEDMESKSEETSRSTVSDITQKVTEITMILSTIEKSEEPETKTKLTTVIEEGTVKTSTALADKETTGTMMAEDMESKLEETSKSTTSETTQKITEIPIISSTIEKSEEPDTTKKPTTVLEESTSKMSTTVADKEKTMTMMAEDMESKSEEASESTTSETTQKVTEIPIISTTTEKSEETETEAKFTTVMKERTAKTSTTIADKETTIAEDKESKSEMTSKSTMFDTTQKMAETSIVSSTTKEITSTVKEEMLSSTMKTPMVKSIEEEMDSFTRESTPPDVEVTKESESAQSLTPLISLEPEETTFKTKESTAFKETVSTEKTETPGDESKKTPVYTTFSTSLGITEASSLQTQEHETVSEKEEISTIKTTEPEITTSTTGHVEKLTISTEITVPTIRTTDLSDHESTFSSELSVEPGKSTAETQKMEITVSEGQETTITSIAPDKFTKSETESSSMITTAELIKVESTTARDKFTEETKMTSIHKLESETVTSSSSSDELKTTSSTEKDQTTGISETSQSISEITKEPSTLASETKTEERTTLKITEKPIFKSEDIASTITSHSVAETEASSPVTSRETAEAEDMASTSVTESSIKQTNITESVPEIKTTEYVSTVTVKPSTIAGIPLIERRLPTDRTERPLTEDLDQVSKSTIISTVSTTGIPITMISETTTPESFETETRISTTGVPISTISDLLRSPTTLESLETEERISTTGVPFSTLSELLRSPTTSTILETETKISTTESPLPTVNETSEFPTTADIFETETRISTTGVIVKNLTERVTEATEMPTKAFKAIETTTMSSSTPVTSTTEETSTRSVTDFLLDEGACIFDGRIFQSAEQILRDDPCEFCFCFRGDIICLQQTCPPPAPNCNRTEIPGFCCPRYDCPVLVTTKNLTAITRRKGVQPIIIQKRIEKRSVRLPTVVKGCDINGTFYEIGSTVTSASWPCLHCMCEDAGNMHCDPRKCKPESPLMLNMKNSLLKTR
ncbi:serine-rich adhesin for platelets [Parasteatoda tepidariorum]|uniref:serine-rich adhesin for platelets n=1 Tax=Parasteatoda tepidariorum TaxID=114398 RepID=UPI001C72324B|nr:mucin-17 [Parasteatoda tepidariorum]